jgi:hypothetical protein
MVLRNLYRGFYDIPNEMQGMRKPDDLMRIIVRNSDTLDRVEKLEENTGLHPSMIFFANNLYENQIQSVMQTLHGEGKKVKKDGKLREFKNLQIVS